MGMSTIARQHVGGRPHDMFAGNLHHFDGVLVVSVGNKRKQISDTVEGRVQAVKS
jgi:hypothetical protein